jgi:hypothetical protein
MRRRIVLLLTLLFIGAVAIGVLWRGNKGIPEVKGLAAMKQPTQSKNPLSDLDKKAKDARGGDVNSISELADDIITKYGFFESDASAKEAVKDRLVGAEVRFQRDGSGGIPEENVALMINGLATEFGAPDFMKTDVQQVRHIRVARMAYLPNLINQRVAGRSVSSELSPLEATFVAMDLIYQKLNVEEFQVTPQEFRANVNKQRLAAWEDHQSRKSQGKEEPAPEAAYQMKEAVPTSKQEELKQISHRAAALMSEGFLSRANSALDTLGIDRLTSNQ